MQSVKVILVLIPIICVLSPVSKADEQNANPKLDNKDDSDPHTWTKRIHTKWGDQVTTQHLMPDGSYHWESIGPYGYSSGIYYSNSGNQGSGFHYSSSNYNSPFGQSDGQYQGMQMSSNGQLNEHGFGQGFGQPGMAQGQGMGMRPGWFPTMKPIKFPKIRMPKFKPFKFEPFPAFEWMHPMPTMQPMEPFKWWPSIFDNQKR